MAFKFLGIGIQVFRIGAYGIIMQGQSTVCLAIGRL